MLKAVAFSAFLTIEAAALSFFTQWGLESMLAALIGTAVVVLFVSIWRSGDRPWYWLSR
jgi:hypothetical protein